MARAVIKSWDEEEVKVGKVQFEIFMDSITLATDMSLDRRCLMCQQITKEEELELFKDSAEVLESFQNGYLTSSLPKP